MIDKETPSESREHLHEQESEPDSFNALYNSGTPDSGHTEYAYRKVIFKECAVVEISTPFRVDEDLWDDLEIGTDLALVRHRGKTEDDNAVAVIIADDFDGFPEDYDFDLALGCLPHSDNSDIAALLDAGYADKLFAEITTLNQSGNFDERIRITIYLESYRPEIVRHDMLRAQYVETREIKGMMEELKVKGSTRFRRGNALPLEPHLPEPGDRIILVNDQKEFYILYMMRVLSIGDQCALYHGEETVGDCLDCKEPLVLNNIMGPLRIKKEDAEFLTGVDISTLSACEYLPTIISDSFEKIFQDIL